MHNTNCEAEKKTQEASEKMREVEQRGLRGADGSLACPEKRKLRCREEGQSARTVDT